MNHVKISPD